jgi:hypothetical protein
MNIILSLLIFVLLASLGACILALMGKVVGRQFGYLPCFASSSMALIAVVGFGAWLYFRAWDTANERIAQLRKELCFSPGVLFVEFDPSLQVNDVDHRVGREKTFQKINSLLESTGFRIESEHDLHHSEPAAYAPNRNIVEFGVVIQVPEGKEIKSGATIIAALPTVARQFFPVIRKQLTSGVLPLFSASVFQRKMNFDLNTLVGR